MIAAPAHAVFFLSAASVQPPREALSEPSNSPCAERGLHKPPLPQPHRELVLLVIRRTELVDYTESLYTSFNNFVKKWPCPSLSLRKNIEITVLGN